MKFKLLDGPFAGQVVEAAVAGDPHGCLDLHTPHPDGTPLPRDHAHRYVQGVGRNEFEYEGQVHSPAPPTPGDRDG